MANKTRLTGEQIVNKLREAERSARDLDRDIASFVEFHNHYRYHESLDNLTPTDVYFGRQKEVLCKREEIKKLTFQQRRLQNSEALLSV